VNYRFFLAISSVGVLAVCTSAAQKAPTQDAPKTQAYKLVQSTVPKTAAVNCGDSTTQTAMNECFGREAKQDQLLLESLLKELAAKLDAPDKERLEEVQSLWVKYRDAHCRWQAGFFEGGSIQPMMYSTRISARTGNRVEEPKPHTREGAAITRSCEASKRSQRPDLTSR